MGNLDGLYNPDAEAGGDDFDALPAGVYEAVIVKHEWRLVSETKDCGKKLSLTWRIVGPQYANRLVWQDINLGWSPNHPSYQKTKEFAERQFAEIRQACGVRQPRDVEDLYERECLIRLKVDKGGEQFRDRNEITKVLPIDRSRAPAARGVAPRPIGGGAGAPASRPASAPAGRGGVFARAREMEPAALDDDIPF